MNFILNILSLTSVLLLAGCGSGSNTFSSQAPSSSSGKVAPAAGNISSVKTENVDVKVVTGYTTNVNPLNAFREQMIAILKWGAVPTSTTDAVIASGQTAADLKSSLTIWFSNRDSASAIFSGATDTSDSSRQSRAWISMTATYNDAGSTASAVSQAQCLEDRLVVSRASDMVDVSDYSGDLQAQYITFRFADSSLDFSYQPSNNICMSVSYPVGADP